MTTTKPPRIPTHVIARMLDLIPGDEQELRDGLLEIVKRYDFLCLPEQYEDVWRAGGNVLVERFGSHPSPTELAGWQKEILNIWFDAEPQAKRLSYAELETALHANRCHPEYTYLVVPPDGMTPGGRALLADWERCPEFAGGAPGDECWRRLKNP